VTITHPYHPLCGQQVKIVRAHHRGADPDLIVQFPDGLHAVIGMSWTDYATPDSEPLIISPPHLLDIDGLRQAVQFIERIRQDNHVAARNSGDETCTSGDEDYG
jgi:hypothetical protein